VVPSVRPVIVVLDVEAGTDVVDHVPLPKGRTATW
jgi:hypothetical protein